MAKLIASLKITSAASAPKSVAFLRLEETNDGYRIKHAVADDAPPGRSTQNVVPLSKAVIEEQLAQLRAAHIPAFPRGHEVQADELVDLAIYDMQSELRAVWLTEPPEGYEVLGNFVTWLRHVVGQLRQQTYQGIP